MGGLVDNEIRSDLSTMIFAMDKPFRQVLKRVVECCFEEGKYDTLLISVSEKMVKEHKTNVAVMELINVLQIELVRKEGVSTDDKSKKTT